MSDIDIPEDAISELEKYGELRQDELHPAAISALEYVKDYLSIDINRTLHLDETMTVAANKYDNRLAEICRETLRRVMNNDPVGERYILGLAWTIRNMEEKRHEPNSVRRTVSRSPVEG